MEEVDFAIKLNIIFRKRRSPFFILYFCYSKNKFMLGKFQQQIKDELALIKDAGLFKEERVITTSPQGASIKSKNWRRGVKFLC